MVFNRFALRIAVRIGALLATLMLLGYLIVSTELRAATAIVAATVVAQVWLVLRLVDRTNRELVRLLDAIKFDDYQQSFTIDELGPTFAELKTTFDEVLGRFRDARLEREVQRRYLEALVEHVPVPLVTVRDDGGVQLLNSAARRLLDAAAELTPAQLADYGPIFRRDLVERAAGGRIVSRIDVDGVQRQVIVSTTQLIVAGASLRLATLQDIQSELDWNELAAWQDMARILSHEILNSLTPISSLARTVDDLVDDLAKQHGPRDELLADIHDAIGTLARRSETLMRFVKNYRRFTQLPPPVLRPLELRDYVTRFERLFAVEWRERGIALHIGETTAGITVHADDALLDQAVINVLRNAADAAVEHRGQRGEVWLDARLSERGRPVLEIGDNGKGVDESLGDRIFLPFFTTKPEGSGIGLALARQVMLLHKGAITALPRPGGGALFRLSF
jgi:two-component system, NtrC family, nitrogen regulation sensor histidine kinase NtrY